MLKRKFQSWEFQYDISSGVLLVFKDDKLISKSTWQWSETEFKSHVKTSVQMITQYEAPIQVGDTVLVNDSQYNNLKSLKSDWKGVVVSLAGANYIIENTEKDSDYKGLNFSREVYLLEKML